MHHKSIIYKEPTGCDFGQFCFLLTTANTLYMFRTLSAPIIRSTKNCVAATGACHVSGWCKDVQGRLSTRQRTLDVFTGYTSSRLMTRTSSCYYSF